MARKIIDRTGETNTANNGQTMTIIACRKYIDIDIQFEDGTIIYKKTYQSFKKGEIENPNYTKNRLGESITANNGQIMTIIAYKNPSNIDVQFEDGTIIYNKKYYDFKRGAIKNPKLKKSNHGVKGHIFNTEILGIAHNAKYITHYTCYCPVCNQGFIANFQQIREHACNNNHPDQKLLTEKQTQN